MPTNKVVSILYRRPKYPNLNIKFLAIYNVKPNDLTDEKLKEIMQNAFLKAHLNWEIISVKVEDHA